MARERGSDDAPAPATAEGTAPGSPGPLRSLPSLGGPGESESFTTVLVALGANVLIAVAKSAAAAVTGSASLVAEAAHSWADAGNEIFLLIANRRSRRPPDPAHPVRSWPRSLRVVLVRGARAVCGRCRGLGDIRRSGTRPSRTSQLLRRRIRGASGLVRFRGNLIPAVGPAGQSRGPGHAAGPDRARAGYL